MPNSFWFLGVDFVMCVSAPISERPLLTALCTTVGSVSVHRDGAPRELTAAAAVYANSLLATLNARRAIKGRDGRTTEGGSSDATDTSLRIATGISGDGAFVASQLGVRVRIFPRCEWAGMLNRRVLDGAQYHRRAHDARALPRTARRDRHRAAGSSCKSNGNALSSGCVRLPHLTYVFAAVARLPRCRREVNSSSFGHRSASQHLTYTIVGLLYNMPGPCISIALLVRSNLCVRLLTTTAETRSTRRAQGR
jgi:hypothetical protein